MNFDITPENAEIYAFTNCRFLREKPRGIILRFHGMGDAFPIHDLIVEGKRLAKQRIFFIYPYTSPWNWMNDVTVRYIDEILAVLLKEHAIGHLPLVCYGESMGGHGALVYSSKGRFSSSACVATCAICDIPYHFIENKSVPPTLVSALAHYETDQNTALDSISPVALINQMPKISYLIIHCEQDKLVNIEKHSDVLVTRMKQAGYDVEYLRVAAAGHCETGSREQDRIEAFLSGIFDS